MENRAVYAAAVLAPVVLLFFLQAGTRAGARARRHSTRSHAHRTALRSLARIAVGALPFQLDALHYLAFLLFLIAALRVELGFVPASGPKEAAVAFAAPVAAVAAPAAPAAEPAAAAADDADDEADAAAAETAVVPHPAVPSGRVPDDPRFNQVVKDMIAAFFSTLQSAEDSTCA